eukprot:UN30892
MEKPPFTSVMGRPVISVLFSVISKSLNIFIFKLWLDSGFIAGIGFMVGCFLVKLYVRNLVKIKHREKILIIGPFLGSFLGISVEFWIYECYECWLIYNEVSPLSGTWKSRWEERQAVMGKNINFYWIDLAIDLVLTFVQFFYTISVDQNEGLVRFWSSMFSLLSFVILLINHKKTLCKEITWNTSVLFYNKFCVLYFFVLSDMLSRIISVCLVFAPGYQYLLVPPYWVSLLLMQTENLKKGEEISMSAIFLDMWTGMGYLCGPLWKQNMGRFTDWYQFKYLLRCCFTLSVALLSAKKHLWRRLAFCSCTISTTLYWHLKKKKFRGIIDGSNNIFIVLEEKTQKPLRVIMTTLRCVKKKSSRICLSWVNIDNFTGRTFTLSNKVPSIEQIILDNNHETTTKIKKKTMKNLKNWLKNRK